MSVLTVDSSFLDKSHL